jgi:glycosyl transferase family 25
MKLIIINLEKSKERLNRISNSLNKLKLSFERFNAIDGYSLTHEEIQNNTTFIGRNFLCNRGIIGCSLSHLNIWKKFIESEDELICICEDDSQFNENFKIIYDNIHNIYQKLNFDFLNLNCGGITYSFHKTIKINNFIFQKPFFPTLFTCYILSKKGAKKLVNHLKNVTYHIDFDIACYNLTNNFEYYSLSSPNILENTCEDSTINGNMLGLLGSLLNFLGLTKINWVLNTPILTFFLDYKVTVYRLLIITLLIYSIRKGFIILSLILALDFIINSF